MLGATTKADRLISLRLVDFSSSKLTNLGSIFLSSHTKDFNNDIRKSPGSSSFELFALSIMQKDVHALRMRLGLICESSLRLGHHEGYTAWPHHLSAT